MSASSSATALFCVGALTLLGRAPRSRGLRNSWKNHASQFSEKEEDILQRQGETQRTIHIVDGRVVLSDSFVYKQ